MSSETRFRKDIQGLRALAVFIVVVFHFLPAALPGGFVGVDVFFVISGFLITNHLLREVEATGSIRLRAFWAKRVRRLIPAAALVLAVSVVIVLSAFPTTAWRQNLTETAWASLYGLNWHLAAQSVDYMAADNPASIVQHFWSLSVEEQFYLVWPLLVLAAAWSGSKIPRLSGKSRKQLVIGLLIAVFVISLGYSVFETTRSQPSAYFVTTTRAWEFALGGIAGVIQPLLQRHLTHLIVSWMGVGLIAFAAFTFDGSTHFPGWIALVPVIGTALLLWAGDSDSAWAPQYFARNGFVQLLGDISYAVYLWHWPALMLYTQLRGRGPGLYAAIGLGALTIVLALLTQKFVEDPIRRSKGRMRRPVVTFGALAATMTLLVALAVAPQAILNSRTEAAAASIEASIEDDAGCFGTRAILNNCQDPFAVTESVNADFAQTDEVKNELDPEHCVVDAPNGSEVSCNIPAGDKSVLLFGDSHAGHLTLGLAESARENGWSYREETLSGCSGFDLPNPEVNDVTYAPCVRWGETMLTEIIGDESIDLVVFAVRTTTKPDRLQRSAEALREIRESGKQVVVVLETPGVEDTIPPSRTAETAPACVASTDEQYDPCSWKLPVWDEWIKPAAEAAGVEMINLRDITCTEGMCHTVIGGTIVYRDTSHFTATFSRTLAPWFTDKLGPLLQDRT